MDFSNPNTLRDSWIVNDGVMGGVSQSSLRQDVDGMFFEGVVSLEIMVALPPCVHRYDFPKKLN